LKKKKKKKKKNKKNKKKKIKKKIKKKKLPEENYNIFKMNLLIFVIWEIKKYWIN